MTDSEIVEVFDNLLNRKWVIAKRGDEFITMGDVADFINRQQAKIEQLQELCGNADGYADALEEYTREKSIKEFAERLVSKAKSTKERFLLESMVESVMKEMGCRDESKT